VVLDQLRTVDKVRLYKHLGKLDETTQIEILEVLQEMFA
jgi:mRNA interferase MazF